MKSNSHTWPIALSVALVLLNVISLHGNWRLGQEAAAARQQAAAWKTYALAAHGQGLRAVELDARTTASTREPPKRLSF